MMKLENLFVLFVTIILLTISKTNGEVKCYFIFGDSLVDPGNNNALNTTAKANYPPYGVDFFRGIATGRFTNGRTVADIIAQYLGFSPIPSYASRPDLIQNGVNYASGGAGILDETGKTLGERITLNAQLANHQSVVTALESTLGGKDATAAYLNRCIYSVGMGSNDYINNYLLPQYYDSFTSYSPEQFADLLIEQYTKQLELLYNLGARKVAVIGVGLIGSIPLETALHQNSSPSVSEINHAVSLYSGKLRTLVDNLNARLPGAKFTFLDTIAISMSKPLQLIGITVPNAPCCVVDGTSKTCKPGITVPNAPCCVVDGTSKTCIPGATPCPNRNEYSFFDNVHPSEAVNIFLGNAYYNSPSPSSFAYPYDIAHLAAL